MLSIFRISSPFKQPLSIEEPPKGSSSSQPALVTQKMSLWPSVIQLFSFPYFLIWTIPKQIISGLYSRVMIQAENEVRAHQDFTLSPSEQLREKPIGLKNRGTDCFLNSVRQCVYNTALGSQLLPHIKNSLPKTWADFQNYKKAREASMGGASDVRNELMAKDQQSGHQDAAEALGFLMAQTPLMNTITTRRFFDSKSLPKGIGQKDIIEEGLHADFSKEYKNAENMTYLEVKSSIASAWDHFAYPQKTHGTAYLLLKGIYEDYPDDPRIIKTSEGPKVEVQIIKESNRFVYPPKHLIFSLKRYEQSETRGHKICDKVEISDSFSLDTRHLNQAQETYRIQAFIYHIGEVGGGHYLAYVKKGSQWYQCDDSDIRPISDIKAKELMKEAYVFFAESTSDKPTSPPTGAKASEKTLTATHSQKGISNETAYVLGYLSKALHQTPFDDANFDQLLRDSQKVYDQIEQDCNCQIVEKKTPLLNWGHEGVTKQIRTKIEALEITATQSEIEQLKETIQYLYREQWCPNHPNPSLLQALDALIESFLRGNLALNKLEEEIYKLVCQDNALDQAHMVQAWYKQREQHSISHLDFFDIFSYFSDVLEKKSVVTKSSITLPLEFDDRSRYFQTLLTDLKRPYSPTGCVLKCDQAAYGLTIGMQKDGQISYEIFTPTGPNALSKSFDQASLFQTKDPSAAAAVLAKLISDRDPLSYYVVSKRAHFWSWPIQKVTHCIRFPQLRLQSQKTKEFKVVKQQLANHALIALSIQLDLTEMGKKASTPEKIHSLFRKVIHVGSLCTENERQKRIQEQLMRRIISLRI